MTTDELRNHLVRTHGFDSWLPVASRDLDDLHDHAHANLIFKDRARIHGHDADGTPCVATLLT